MPYVDAEPVKLPFGGNEPIAQHCSYQGAKAAADTASRQALQLLAAYGEHGPLTDAEAAVIIRVDRSIINARRNWLMGVDYRPGGVKRVPLVKSHGSRKNPVSGVSNTTWGLV